MRLRACYIEYPHLESFRPLSQILDSGEGLGLNRAGILFGSRLKKKILEPQLDRRRSMTLLGRLWPLTLKFDRATWSFF